MSKNTPLYNESKDEYSESRRDTCSYVYRARDDFWGNTLLKSEKIVGATLPNHFFSLGCFTQRDKSGHKSTLSFHVSHLGNEWRLNPKPKSDILGPKHNKDLGLMW